LRITADTNLLARAVMQDDPAQARAAGRALQDAGLIAVPLPVLCELVWVLRRAYGLARSDVHEAVRALIDTANVAVDRPAAEAGLAALEAGGDFADGVIVHEGARLGGEVFVTFDRQAAGIAEAQGREVRLLTA
jgi:predicted nucleic-acid-binding protein